MKATIYHNPRCSKSRETLKLLQSKGEGLKIEIVEYLKNPPSPEELARILKKLKMSPIDLIRKKEAFFKENYKGQEKSDAEWLRLMSQNPVLIERPIVLVGSKAAIGRPPENIEKLF